MMEVCNFCGAAHHANITCPICRAHMKWLPHESKKAIKKGVIGYPVGIEENSPWANNIKALQNVQMANRQIQKSR